VTVTNVSGGATVTFTTSDVGTPCWIAYGQRGAPLSTYMLSNVDTSQTVQRSITVPGLDILFGPHRGPAGESGSIAVLCNGTAAQRY